MKAKIQAILSESRRLGLTRQCGGTAVFCDLVELAIIAAKARNFANEDQAAAFAVIHLVRACGSKATPADIARYFEAALAGIPEKPIKKPATHR